MGPVALGSKWYEVKLPFEENVSLVFVNYEMNQNRLNKLKKKLS